MLQAPHMLQALHMLQAPHTLMYILCFTERQMPQQDTCTKGQSIHIFCSCCVHLTIRPAIKSKVG
jgi:hypothetical protein